MTARTRYFVIASLLVLAVGLGTGLVAYYVGFQNQSASGVGPAELQYVPGSAAVVAYAEVREIMTSGVRETIRRAAPGQDEGQREFLEETGIDIESDIDRVVASLHVLDDGETAGLVVARGRYSDVNIEALMRKRGAEVETYKGQRLIVRDARPGRGELALSFLEPGLVAVGGSQAVRAAIDLRQSGDNVTKNVELMELLRSLDRGNAWVIGRLDALRADGRLPAQVAAQLPAIQWFSVSGVVDRDVRGVVRADARDEDAAQNLRDVVRGFLALAKLQAGSRPELQTTIQSLELGGTGKSVALSFAIPGEVFEGLGSRVATQPTPVQ